MYHNIFDTHSHYDDSKFDPDREELLNNLQSQGVSLVVSCGCDIDSTQFNFDLAQKYNYMYFAAGFHPENLNGATLDDLKAQIELAKKLDMPIIVHDRDAHGDTLDIFRETKPKGVVHCFSGSKEMAREIIKLGMYIGLNGVVTFNNARKSLEVAKEIPIERLVLETAFRYHKRKRKKTI